MGTKRLILCTNDDGYLAPGLALLASVARKLGDVSIVAPDREQSATSHSLTLHRPLRVREFDRRSYHVDGTPTDCVLLALGEVLGGRPDWVFSGLNHGPNLGEDVLYSGTVAAAMEATLLGIPAVSLSFATEGFDPPGEEYGPVLLGVLELIARAQRFPRGTLLNVNIPDRPPDQIRGVRVTTLGQRVYVESLTRSTDPHGQEYYWIGGGEPRWSGREDSDFRAVESGYISLTPIHLDLTDYEMLEEFATWDLRLDPDSTTSSGDT
jgi:5'-nucleotidase